MRIKMKENTKHKNSFKETRTELLEILKKLKTEENSREEIQQEIYNIIDCFGEELTIYSLLLYCTKKLRKNRKLNGKKQHYKDIHNKKLWYRKCRYSYKYKIIYL